MAKLIKFIKNRSDIGAGTRGSDLGIDAIEIAAINKGNDFFHRYPALDVPTRNDAVYENGVNAFAKHIQQIYEQCRDVATTVEKCLKDGYLPLVFSGDHSSAIGTIAGIKSAFLNKKLGVVWIDAHADIHSPYTTPSGNMHGMSLAALLGEDNLPCQVNEVDKETINQWERLKNLAVPGPKFQPQHLAYFGARDTEEQEEILINQHSIANFSVSEVRHRGVGATVVKALDKLDDCDLLYISFDVDSMDSELISEGTGTPVPRGFVPSEIIIVLQKLFQTGKVVCLEIAEVNPLLDKQGNKMAEVAFDILEKVVPTWEKATSSP